MKTDRKRLSGSIPVIGISSLLVIFAVLCLILLSVLSISTVKADEGFSEKSSLAVEEYYAAEGEAQRCLTLLRQGLVSENVEHNGVSCDGYDIYNYAVRVNDNSVLKVEVEIKDSDYNVLKWHVVSAAEWNADELIKVWDGDEL